MDQEHLREQPDTDPDKRSGIKIVLTARRGLPRLGLVREQLLYPGGLERARVLQELATQNAEVALAGDRAESERGQGASFRVYLPAFTGETQ